MYELLWPPKRTSPDSPRVSLGRIPTPTVPDWYCRGPRGYLPGVDIVAVRQPGDINLVGQRAPATRKKKVSRA